MSEINRDIGAAPDLEWVDICLIDVDSSYQREIRPALVQRILKRFSWAKFGAVVLTRKDDGRFNVVEGQHRWKAAELHPDVSKIPAVIVAHVGTADEAGNFLAINRDRMSVTSVEQYWAGLTAGDETAKAISAVLQSAGCDVVPSAGYYRPNLTNSIGAISLHLRNLREQNPAVLTLYGLSENDGSSPLRGRVCWEQNMRREHLLPALQLAKTCLYLHRHVAPHNGVRAEAIAGGLQTAAARVGLRNFRQNCLTFFHVLEECFGITSIEYKRAAPQIRGSFLLNLARLFSRHENFWDDAGLLLCVDSSWRRTLARFPMSDPHVVQLAGSGGPAMEILYDLMVKHMNSGKRTNRLIPREPGR